MLRVVRPCSPGYVERCEHEKGEREREKADSRLLAGARPVGDKRETREWGPLRVSNT